MQGGKSTHADYAPPSGQVGLTGPVTSPVGGTLPVRGDLAHIALARRYLVAAYAVPVVMQVGSDEAPLHTARDARSDEVSMLDAGSAFEALDVTESWVWGCVGPEGPSGYVPRAAFA